MNPAIFISLCALFFTLFSFYWLHFRRGRLVVSPPRTFACLGGAQRDRASIYLPLIFFNDGAACQIIENLRLSLLESPAGPLRFIATVDQLGDSEPRHYAAPFAIAGREAKTMVCEFQHPASLSFEAKTYPCRVDVRLSGHGEDWKEAVTFELRLDGRKATTANGNALAVLDND